MVDGSKTAYQYNPLGHLEELSHASVDGVLDRYKYSYDAMGNRTEIIKERKDIPEESGTYSYVYDSLNRLREVTKDGQALRSYEYDGFGNRTKMTDGQVETSYSFNALNQLISTADSLGNEQRYTYDKRGNLAQLHKNNILENQYQFGALNRLEQVKNHVTGEGAEYRYDGFGNRVGQSIGQLNDKSDINPTRHIDDVVDMTKQCNNLLERYEDSTATSYIWDTNLLYADTGNSVQSYKLDEMGSPVRFGDEVYGYDEFGNAHHTTPSTQPFGFTGYQHDSIAGTWFAQAREYDANTGRFTSEDIVKGMGHEPHTLNPYTYCWNRPLNFVDLNGQYPEYPDESNGTELSPSEATGLLALIVAASIPFFSNLYNYEIANLDINNTDPAVVLNSTFLSGYRGQIVFRMTFLRGAFSVGPVIGINRRVRDTPAGRRLLGHEHAHNIQLQPLGIGRWWLGIRLPSLINADRGFQPYFRQPWEIHADMLAGIIGDRPDVDIDGYGNYIPQHTTNALLLGLAYFHFISTAHIQELRDNVMAFANHDFSAIKDGGWDMMR